jgi:hypothetical protein
MIQTIKDLLLLRLNVTERVIQFIWISYLATEGITWFSWLWFSFGQVWQQGAFASMSTASHIVQSFAHTAIVYILLKLATKLLVEKSL